MYMSEKKGNVDVVSYNLYYSLNPLLFTKFKPHHSEKWSDNVKALSHFWMPVFQHPPSCRTTCFKYLKHNYKCTTGNAVRASAKLLHPAPQYRAFLCKRQIMVLHAGPPILSLTNPDAVPPPKPAPRSWKPSSMRLCGTSKPGTPEVALTESWQATCDVTESGVTMASDLLMFIGNE